MEKLKKVECMFSLKFFQTNNYSPDLNPLTYIVIFTFKSPSWFENVRLGLNESSSDNKTKIYFFKNPLRHKNHCTV